jgi:2-hydroxy-3-oxopropionate reductase
MMRSMSTAPSFAPIDRTTEIAFIGLGFMGGGFVGRLLRGGWRVLASDIVAEKRQAMVKLGAREAATASEAAQAAPVVVLSLPSSAVTERVAETSVLPHARPGQIVIDLGTTRVAPTRRYAEQMAAAGGAWLDAPVSGSGANPVRMFAGGDAAAFAAAKPLLDVLALTLRHCGPSGAGQIVKGVNQLCMGMVRAAWFEAVSFATRQGISPDELREAICKDADSGWRLELIRVCDHLAAGKGEADDMKFAELPYFLEAAEDAGIALPMTRALYDFCREGPLDWRDSMNRPYVSFWHMLHAEARTSPHGEAGDTVPRQQT